MALRAPLTPEQLDELCRAATLREALVEWLLSEGETAWNDWQRGFAAIRTRYRGVDPEAEAPEQIAYSTWSRHLWNELSEEVFGPDWRERRAANVAPSPSATPNFGPRGGVTGLATGGAPAPAAAADGPPAAGVAGRSRLWGLLPTTGPKALNFDVSSAPGDNGASRVPPTEFSIATPRAKDLRIGSDPGRALPRTPSQAAAGFGPALPDHLIDPLLYEYLLAQDVDEDESSDAALDRLNQAGFELVAAGHSQQVAEAVIDHEWHVRDLYKMWRRDVEETGSGASFAFWSLRKMMTTDFASITDAARLEMQVRGLARLAGLSFEEASVAMDRAWTNSQRGWNSSPGATSVRATPESGPTEAASVEQLAAAREREQRSPAGPSTLRRSVPSPGRQDPFKTPSPPRPSAWAAPQLPTGGPKGPWTGIAAHRGTPVVPRMPDMSGVPADAVPGSPPAVTSPSRDAVDREMLEMVKDVRATLASAPRPPAPPERAPLSQEEILALMSRQSSPLAGLEYKQSLPVIKDSDLDFDKHLRDFKGIIDCYALTRKDSVRPYDLLVVFKKTLAVGSTRMKIYENEIALAVRANRLPLQAQAVYDEILAKMKSVLRESKLQKQSRVESEFNALEMGRLPHSTFLVEWERLLIALVDADVVLPDAATLFRRYMQKLTTELRSALMSRTWVLDKGPPRKPETWEECAECVAQELEGRADSKAPREMVNAIAVGSMLTCQYCRRHDHHTELCPKKAADVRGESNKCVADHEMQGRTCSICHHADHSEEHHRLAAMDLVSDPSQLARTSKKGENHRREESSGRDSNRRSPSKVPAAERIARPCRFGKDCRSWKLGECAYEHDGSASGSGGKKPQQNEPRSPGGKCFRRRKRRLQSG